MRTPPDCLIRNGGATALSRAVGPINKMIVGAVALLFWTASPAAALPMITGAVAYDFGNQVWSTEGFRWALWLKPGDTSGPFLNGPGRQVSIPLQPGTNTFIILGNLGGYDEPAHGLSLHFDGGALPGISVSAPTDRSSTEDPAFSAIPGGMLIMSLGGSPNSVAAPGTLSYATGAETVILTDFRWTHPSVDGLDLVNPGSPSPGSGPDYVGTFTLEVIPEPSTALLFGLGLVAMGVRRRRA
jgi:hypothetical protein